MYKYTYVCIQIYIYIYIYIYKYTHTTILCHIDILRVKPKQQLSAIEPTRAVSLFLVYHTARAASGRLVPTRIRSLAAAAVREAGSPLT